MRFLFLTYILISASAASRAQAQEMYEFFTGVRALGMGGASVAVVNDETALLSNPAGLGKLRDYFLTVADPELEVGAQTEGMYSTGVVDITDPQKALNKAKLKIGQHGSARGQLFPSLVVPNFGVGIYARSMADAEVPTADPTHFYYNYTRDYAAVFGFNFRIWDGIIKLGINAKGIDRTEIHDNTILASSTNLTLQSLASSGFGIGSDAGLILSSPTAWLPSIAGVYRNMGRTSFNVRDGMFLRTTNKPNSIPETMDAAVAIHPIITPNVRMSWTLEYTDVQDAMKEKDTAKKYHGGFELNIYDALFLRGGMNQRYWTAGMELSMGNYQFQAASYGEEIGIYPAKREDRRYVAKFAFRF
jgi:hypothetical protein